MPPGLAAGALVLMAAYFELVIDPRRTALGMECGLPCSFALQRLVLLHARAERLDEAARQWRTFNDTFTNPDPEVRHLVEKARSAPPGWGR